MLTVGDWIVAPCFWTGIDAVGGVANVNADFLLLLAEDRVTPSGLDDNRGISPKEGSCNLKLIKIRSSANLEYILKKKKRK
jgi:hypothetical protein